MIELSKRQEEVLGLMAQGLSNPEICEKLFISMTTVKTHIYEIYKRLGIFPYHRYKHGGDGSMRVKAVLKYLEMRKNG